MPNVTQPATPAAPPPPQSLSASELGTSYPQLNPNLLGDLQSKGVQFVVDSDIGFQRNLSNRRLRQNEGIGNIPGRYTPGDRTLRINPGASLGTVAHEVLHAATGLAPQYINTALMTRSQRLSFQQTGRAYRAIPGPGEGANIANFVSFMLAGGRGQITGEAETIAHSLAGTTPSNPYNINAFGNIFSSGVVPLSMIPRIQSGVRK